MFKEDQSHFDKSGSDISPQYYVRKMRYQGSLMINICDENLLGKTIKDESVNIEITRDFFNELMSEEEIHYLLKRCSIANLIGERVIKKTLKLGLAKKESVKVISDIPFLMIYTFQGNY
ncbi:MAG TPA: DUF424 family protein [Nitrososphaeraceae archaeon]|nr:DUF424 family protein [Nitrososphaeraceae archaeon]